MPTIFMDPVGGNDANDGLTFATRKRTFYSATQATTSYGDVVRVIASPDPVSVGDASWTDNSKVISWTNPSNKLIDGCDAGWTGVTNATVTHPTTATARKTGTSYLNVAIATAFTTGKIAYKTLATPLDLSAFQQIGFYFRASSASSTRNIKVALCSDTTGDTVVAEMTLAITSTEYGTTLWTPFHMDFGSAFPSTEINSISIHVTTDPGSVSFQFDGFVACKAPGAADLIDYYSLFGKNTEGEPTWYTVLELSESGVVIGGNQYDTINNVRPYRGPTETVPTFIRNPIKLVGPWGYAYEARLGSAYFTVEGGYNRTDMSTKTGETWLCGRHQFYGMSGYDQSYFNADIKNFGFSHCDYGMYHLVFGTGDPMGGEFGAADYEFLGFSGCLRPYSVRLSNFSSGNQNRYTEDSKFSCKFVWAPYYPVPTPSRPGVYTIGRIHGMSNTANAAWQPGLSLEQNPSTLNIGKIDNNAYAIDCARAVSEVRLNGTVIENNTNLLLNRPYLDTDCYLPLRLHFHDMADLVWDETTGQNRFIITSVGKYPSVIRQTKIGGDPTKNRVLLDGHLMFESRQDIRYTASGYSWRMYLENWMNFLVYRPEAAQGFPLAHIAVEAGKQVTATCWIYIEHDVHMPYGSYSPEAAGVWGIMVMADAALGLSRSMMPADTTIHGTWQQVTLTFTPSADGVVPICAYGWGSGDYLNPPAMLSAYFDVLEVTQEA